MNRLHHHLVRLATQLLRIYAGSWRVTVRSEDGRSSTREDHRFGNEIYAIREHDLVALISVAPFARFHTMIAVGRDGDWASIVAQVFGFAVVRGSSRHDPAAAAMALVRDLRRSHSPAFLVVDGPLGPSGVAKEGIGTIARLTHRSVVPVATDANASVVIPRTWSRMTVPLPFARVTIRLGAPIEVAAHADRETVDRVAQLVSRHFADTVPEPPGSHESPDEVVVH